MKARPTCSNSLQNVWGADCPHPAKKPDRRIYAMIVRAPTRYAWMTVSQDWKRIAPTVLTGYPDISLQDGVLSGW